MSNLRTRFRTFKWIFIISLRFRPRILVDVSRIDLSTTILDYKISAPIIIAPTAFHKLANPEGLIPSSRCTS